MSERWETVPVSREVRKALWGREPDERSPMPGGFPE